MGPGCSWTSPPQWFHGQPTEPPPPLPPLAVDNLPAFPKDRVPSNADDTVPTNNFIEVSRARGHWTAPLLVPTEIVTPTRNRYDTREDDASSKILLDDPSLPPNPTTPPHPTTSPSLTSPGDLPSVRASLGTNFPDRMPVRFVNVVADINRNFHTLGSWYQNLDKDVQGLQGHQLDPQSIEVMVQDKLSVAGGVVPRLTSLKLTIVGIAPQVLRLDTNLATYVTNYTSLLVCLFYHID
jgi:hypothetical protein